MFQKYLKKRLDEMRNWWYINKHNFHYYIIMESIEKNNRDAAESGMRK
jgi:hypothetical protein